MINTNNFFKRNISIRNPAVPYKKGKFIDQSAEYKSRVFSRVQESPLTKTLLSMRKNVLGIENALRGLFELDKKKQTTDQKFDLAEKQEAKDKPKVKPKTPKIFGNIVERPKTGIIDAVKNFVTFTFLGWLFTRLQPFIDKAGGLVPLLENIMKFFSGLIVGTLNAFASFLKFGYDVKDTFDLKIKEIKKEAEGISKHFDNTLGELKTVFSGAIEIVNSFLNTSVDEEELKTARQDASKDSPETNIPPLPKLPDVATVSPSSSAASNISRDSPTGKTSPQSTPISTTSPTIYKVNTGGRIDPTKTPITRVTEQKEKRVIRRKPDIQQQKTVPGKDVGGEDKVKEVYGEETGTFKSDLIPNSIFFRTETKSGYAGLLKAAEEYKRPNDRDILGLGNLMGATVDTALGQKLERRTITQFADGIKYLVEQGMSNPEEFKKIDLEDMVRKIVEPKVNMAINRIREEINKKSIVESGPGEGGEGGYTGGEYGGYSPTSGLEKEIYDYLINVKKMNDIQALGLMANISRESSFIPNNREPGGTGIGLFQWSHGRVAPFIRAVPDWETNWKAQIDYALSEPKHLSLVEPGGYQAKNFSSAQEAADWWMKKWERPADEASGSIKHQQYLANVPRSPEGTAKFRSGSFGGVEAMGAGFKTGLKTGPAGRIGAGTEYHVDARIVPDLPLRDKIAMIDSMAAAHAQEGYVMEFSGRGVAGSRWDPNMSYSEKEKLARKVLKSHWAARSGWEPFDYFIVKKAARDRYDISAQGSNIMAPRIPGGSYVYGEGGGRGRFLSIRDKNGREIFQVMHGDKGVPSPKKIGQIFKMDELKGASTSQRSRTPRQSPKPEIQRITQTPPGEPYLIKGKMYYVDLKNNKVFTINGKGDRVEVKVGPGQNEWLLKEIYKMRQLRQNQKISFSKIPPTTPAEKYASYNQPDSQKPSYIQPIIIKELVPVSTGSGSIIAFAPPSISNDKSQSLSRG